MKLIAHDAMARGVLERDTPRWRENYVNESLFYSHRTTEYDKESFPSTLHYHDYYEVLVFVQGDIRYICEGEAHTLRYGDIVIVPPGCVHMSMLNAERSQYERHVFYLYPDALDKLGAGVLTSFLGRISANTLTVLTAPSRRELLALLEELDAALSTGTREEGALAISHLLRVFYMLNSATAYEEGVSTLLPEHVLSIQRYIDEHFAEITSVSDVAHHFFYSREYVSRLFKQYFNTSVADYLRTRRVAHSCKLIAAGVPLSEICFMVGFGNLSTFIRSFRAVTGLTPSAWRSMQ